MVAPLDGKSLDYASTYTSSTIGELRRALWRRTSDDADEKGKFEKSHKTTLIARHQQLDRQWLELLDYDTCSPKELRKFLQDRTTLDSAATQQLKKTRKNDLIPRLQKLDMERTFTFLDLPPELRLEVYRHALVFIDKMKSVDVALLAVSKLVRKEAEPILYHENEFHVEVDGAMGYGTKILTPGRAEKYRFGIGDLCSLRVTLQGPEMLRKVRHLTIHLDLLTVSKSHRPENHKRARKELAILSMILSGSTRLKKATFIVDFDKADFDTAALVEFAWPVALLHSRVELEFKGLSLLGYHFELENEGWRLLGNEFDSYRQALKTDRYLSLQPLGDLLFRVQDRTKHLENSTLRSCSRSAVVAKCDHIFLEFIGCLASNVFDGESITAESSLEAEGSGYVFKNNDQEDLHSLADVWVVLQSYAHESEEALFQLLREPLEYMWPGSLGGYLTRGWREGKRATAGEVLQRVLQSIGRLNQSAG